MWFGVLGPLAVRASDGRVVSVTRRLHRALLAALLLRANRPALVIELAEILWQGEEPDPVRRRLKSHIWALRRLLSEVGESDRIESSPGGGYLLRLEPDEFDLMIFERLAEEGVRALDRGETVLAADRLAQALSLWRGRLLEDVVAGAGLAGQVAAVEERRWVVVETRFEAELGAGRHAAVVPDIRAAIEQAPHRERLWGQLMMALYRSGRQTEALAAFQELRKHLIEESGVEPGPSLRTLQGQILAADVELDPSPAGSAGLTGSSSPTPAGSSSPISDESQRPSDSGTPATRKPRQLPSPVRDFVGRADELAALTSRVTELRQNPLGPAVICVVDGAAGVGKTALATQFAHQQRLQFPDGQLYVDLRGFGPLTPAQPSEVLESFLLALGVSPARIPTEQDARTAMLRTQLADRRVLILLDNARDTTQVRPLLPGPGALVIVTSRNQLRGLTTREAAHPLTLHAPSGTGAIVLLTKILGRRRVAAESTTAARLVEACDRLPLAIRLVAERAVRQPALTLSHLLDQIDEPDRLSSFDAADGEDTNLRNVLSWSYRTLPAESARAFRLLSVPTTPSISSGAAAALLGEPVSRAAQILDPLLKVHLLRQDTASRYQFHDLVREYAAERVAVEQSDQDRQLALDRYLSWYLHNASRACRTLDRPHVYLPAIEPVMSGVQLLDFGDRRSALRWWEAERRTVVGLVRFTAERGRHPMTCWLAVAMRPFLNLRRYYDDWFAVSDVSRAAAGHVDDPALQVVALNCAAAPYRAVGRYQEASELHRQALDRSQAAGVASLQVASHAGVGVTLSLDGQHEAGLRHLLQAQELGLQANPSYAAALLNNIAMVYTRMGRPREAAEFGEQALKLYRERGDQYGEMHALDTLGVAHLRAGVHTQAITHFRPAAAMARELEHREQEAATLSDLGRALHHCGQRREARRIWSQARRLYAEFGDPRADQPDAAFQQEPDRPR